MVHSDVYVNGELCLDILQNRWSPTYDIVAILANIQSLYLIANNRMLRLRRGEGLDGDSEEGVISCKAFCHFSCSVFFYRYSSCSCILLSHNSDSRISAPSMRQSVVICRRIDRTCGVVTSLNKRLNLVVAPQSQAPNLHSIPVFLLPALRIQRVD